MFVSWPIEGFSFRAESYSGAIYTFLNFGGDKTKTNPGTKLTFFSLWIFRQSEVVQKAYPEIKTNKAWTIIWFDEKKSFV